MKSSNRDTEANREVSTFVPFRIQDSSVFKHQARYRGYFSRCSGYANSEWLAGSVKPGADLLQSKLLNEQAYVWPTVGIGIATIPNFGSRFLSNPCHVWKRVKIYVNLISKRFKCCEASQRDKSSTLHDTSVTS